MNSFGLLEAAMAVGTRAGGRIVSVFAAVVGIVATAMADDVTISTAGTRAFEAGGSYGTIRNEASGDVTLVSSGAAVEGAAIAVTNFDAVANAATTFSGGWWDFGVLSATEYPTNFFAYPSSASGRTTALDGGAVVTNVGCAFLAGASGTDNTLEIKGGSQMTVREMVFGKAQSAQRSKCTVSGGSKLHCLGRLSMSEGSARDHERNLTRNELVVHGEDSSLVVDGITYIGRNLGYNYNGGLGGNTLAVSNNATADFNGGIIMDDAVVHGMCNRVVFSDGARVNMASFKADYDWSSTAKPSSNIVEILSGAVVTNTGVFTIGLHYNDKSQTGNSVVISNATLVTKPGKYGSSTGFLCGPHMTARLSGPDAKLEFTTFPEFFFTESAYGTFIVENGAKFNYGKPYFAMNNSICGHRFIVRSGATATVANGFRPCSDKFSGSNNLIRVENDGYLKGSGVIGVVGKSNTMEVVEGKVYTGYYMYVGQAREGDGTIAANSGSNCLLHVEGRHPSVRINWAAYVYNGSTVRIALPKEGYEEGHAVSTNAVVYVIAVGQGMSFDDSCKLELTGAEEMLKYHRAHKMKADYYLLGDGTPASYILSDDQLEAVQATLPSEMTIYRKTVSNREHVILSVRPKWGTNIVIL